VRKLATQATDSCAALLDHLQAVNFRNAPATWGVMTRDVGAAAAIVALNYEIPVTIIDRNLRVSAEAGSRQLNILSLSSCCEWTLLCKCWQEF
jgi:hypothetical protein